MSDNSMDLAGFLKQEYYAYRERMEKTKGQTPSEADWVRKELTPRLKQFDRRDQFSIASVNDWINGRRMPTGENFVRCIKVWGLRILPFLGVPQETWGDEDLVDLIQNWDKASPTARKNAKRVLTGKDDLGELVEDPVMAG